jgi:hypothetical protein
MFSENTGPRVVADQTAQSLLIADFRRDFPEFRFATQTTWSGVSIVAIRQDGAEGLHTIVTPDADEMRTELALSHATAAVPGLARG